MDGIIITIRPSMVLSQKGLLSFRSLMSQVELPYERTSKTSCLVRLTKDKGQMWYDFTAMKYLGK